MCKMKKIVKRVAILIISMLFAVSASACGKTVTVMELDGYKISANEYQYWLSVYKSYYLYYYNSSKDETEFWLSDAGDGMTYAEYATAVINENVKRTLVGIKLFDDYNLKLGSETVKAIENEISENIEYYGGRSAFNAVLAKLGINVSMLENIYKAEAKLALLEEYLYGDSGIVNVSEDEYSEYFAENYINIKYLIIYTNEVAVLDDDGSLVYDSEGNYVTRKFSDDEKAEINARILTAHAAAEGGEDFDQLISSYSDVDMSSYPNGFYLSPRDYAMHEEVVSEAALRMQVGEVAMVENDYATYIIKKYETPTLTALSDADLATLTNFITVAKEDMYLGMLTEAAFEVTVYDEELAKFSIITAAYNSQI